MNNFIAGLFGFLTAQILVSSHSSVSVTRVVRKNPRGLKCQFCDLQIPRRREKSALSCYKRHLSFCSAIIPVVERESVKKGSGNPPESGEKAQQECAPSKVD